MDKSVSIYILLYPRSVKFGMRILFPYLAVSILTKTELSFQTSNIIYLTCPLIGHVNMRTPKMFLKVLRGGKRAPSKKKTVHVQPDSSDETDTGPAYQEPTPLLKDHTDTISPRDAASYAAEAARCMSEFDIDGALACYAEAVQLEPRSGVILDAYASLLADQGRSDLNATLVVVYHWNFGSLPE